MEFWSPEASQFVARSFGALRPCMSLAEKEGAGIEFNTGNAQN